MRIVIFAAALCCASSSFAQERLYTFQMPLADANVISRALQANQTWDGFRVHSKMQDAVTQQDQAAAEAYRAAIEKDIRSKIEPPKTESPQ